MYKICKALVWWGTFFIKKNKMGILGGLYVYINVNSYKRMAHLLFVIYAMFMGNCMLNGMSYILFLFLEEGAE